jgi:regulator of sigma E protease
LELIDLIPQFGGFAGTVLAFIVALSVIVFVHEYGHYIVGRWCGIRAEVFSMGFGPVLAKWHDRRGTRWQIAALPFGGYVKFLGDSDAASGKDAEALDGMAEAARRETMHGAPLWARTATVAAGPAFNFVLSVLVFGAIYLFGGIATDTPTVGAMKPLPQSAEIDLRAGDRILAVNGAETPDYEALYAYAREAEPARLKSYVVERDGATLTVPGPFPLLPIVEAVQPQSAALSAGLQAGDVILAVDGDEIAAFHQLQKIVANSGGDPLALKVWRDGAVLDFQLLPKVVDLPLPEGGWEQRTMIGISGGTFFEPETYTPGPVEALTRGAEATWGVVTISLDGLWHVITGAISTCNLQGPIGIAETSAAAASQGVQSFVWFIAVLSTAVGLLNLFPIPVLDGGHLVFFGYEAVFRRPPSDLALRIMMAAGLALILTFMLFALSNDLFCP